mmetsp:Transcript_4312/g.6021  ORF Transcript_4312/g.6021 Transcript_4312/m.6021 type:complete len:101 (-) Transcript_4312:1006-1308(-)
MMVSKYPKNDGFNIESFCNFTSSNKSLHHGNEHGLLVVTMLDCKFLENKDKSAIVHYVDAYDDLKDNLWIFLHIQNAYFYQVSTLCISAQVFDTCFVDNM